MRILFISASYPPVLGGLQTVVHTLACHLEAAGHDVRVVTNRYPRGLPRAEIVDGVCVRRELFMAPRPDYLRRRPDLFAAALFHYPLTLRHIHRLVAEFRPEVVNVHFPDDAVPFVVHLRRHHRFRLVVSLHGHEVLRWFNIRGRLPAGTPRGAADLVGLLRDSEAVIACSQYLLDRAVDLEPSVASTGMVIPNGIDPARFEDHSVYKRPRPYILAYGRLTHTKGFDLLLEAFGQIADQHPDFDLVIAGAGEERSSLAQRAAELGIAPRVEFFGRATQQEIVRLLNGSVLLAVPSREETLGIVALEGLAAGKPVLATRVGGLPEIIREPPNMLVEPSVEGLWQGLDTLINRYRELDSAMSSNLALAQQYTWSKAIEEYQHVFGII